MKPIPRGTLTDLRADPALLPLHPSLDYSYGDPARGAALDEMYGRFVSPGDLVFDVGSHVGDRVASFRRLGARVVALEPQPLCQRVLGALYADDPDVEVVGAACGGAEGTVPMRINSANPTVSTASDSFPAAASGARGWEGQVWDTEITVPVVTLDALIARFGRPAFIKIDVEGYEEQVLAGLGAPVPALSFEFTTIMRDAARRCLDLAAGLGFHRFNLSVGDSMSWALPDWSGPDEVAAHVLGLPHEANSGDIYAVS